MSPSDSALRTVLDELLTNDSDLVGQGELARLALARDLLALSPVQRRLPGIRTFLQQVTADVLTRTSPLVGPCQYGPHGHLWQVSEGGYRRTWPDLRITTDDQFDGVTAQIAGVPETSDTGAGPTLLRCSHPGCGTERYVPFDWDVGWTS